VRSYRVGRRVLYRRVDVEKWLESCLESFDEEDAMT
jgi:hypothetical protein